MVLPKNTQAPCFCHGNCPPGSRPFLKYFVQTDNASPYAAYFLGKLYVHAFAIPEDKFCRWGPQEPEPGYITESLIKESPLIPPTTTEYSFGMAIDDGIGAPHTWLLLVDWDPADLPYDQFVTPSCDMTPFEPDTQTPPMATLGVVIRSAPEWCCTDEQVREWADRYPLT